MPIVESDLIHRLSGAVNNGSPDLSIGGVMSTDPVGVIISDEDNNDMDDITSTEALAGIVIYRGYYYSNEVGTALTWTDPVFWIESATSHGNTSVEIAIADEAKNVFIELLPNEETAPSGPSFTTPANQAAGLLIGSLDQGDFRGHWVKYNVLASSNSATDQYTIKAAGDTLA